MFSFVVTALLVGELPVRPANLWPVVYVVAGAGIVATIPAFLLSFWPAARWVKFVLFRT